MPAALAAAGLLALSAAPAAAAPTWLPAVDISGTQNMPCPSGPDPSLPVICASSIARPQIAIGADGRASALWSPYTSGGGPHVMGSERPPGGSFSAPAEIANASALTPKFGLDSQGNATAVWNRITGSQYRVETAFRAVNGSYGLATQLGGDGSTAPALAVAPNGAAIAAWARGGPSGKIEASYRPAGGSFGAATPISAAGSSGLQSPDVAIDADGDALVVWSRVYGSPSNYRPESVFKPAGSSFQPATPLSTGLGSSVRVVMSAAGDAAASWLGPSTVVQVALRPAAGPFGVESTISAANAYPTPDLAINAAGDVLAAWSRFVSGSGYQAEWASRSAGGSFSTPQGLAGAGTYVVDLEFLPNGDAVALWPRYAGSGDNRVESALRPAGGSFGAATTVFQSANSLQDVDLAIDPEGNAAAIWTYYQFAPGGSSASERTYAAGFDGAGPRLDNLQVAEQGHAGQALSFSVQAADVWSAVPTVAWEFGDGATAMGTAAEHSYAAAGTYQAKVTATDAVGNSTSTTRTVTISQLPPGGTVPPPPADKTAPIATGFYSTNDVFRVGRIVTALTGAIRRPVGTKFKFRSSEAGTARIRIEQARPGRRVGRRCRTPTRARRNKPRCTRWVRRGGTITRAARRKSNTVKFSGRFGTRVLRPGRYRANLTVTDSAGNRSKVRRTGFRIAR